MRLAVITSQHRSLRQAAEPINIRQSTLSRRLRDLEYCLGSVLFEQTSGGTRPTIEGQEFSKRRNASSKKPMRLLFGCPYLRTS
ncbi:helix-turn-helix domain-containing protein [Endosaccharibacter trunci]|uniref:helix-turn-helix domain-containing protein n=1 Tax=Endosaccharibacter trunci TaxID=2812733 RepID=UPI003BF60000